MAVFCSSCGTAIGEGAKFCPACGKPAQDSAASPAFTAPPPPPASSGGMKILFIVLGVIGLLVVLMIGSCFYIGYKVKKAAHDFGSNATPYTGKREPCSFVNVEEATAALGTPVQTAVARGPSNCDYSLGTDGSEHMLVSFVWRGGKGIMGLTHSAMNLGGKGSFTELPGLGDEAFLAPGDTTLMMRKGDVMVTIDLRSAGQNAEGGKKMAAIIAEKLESADKL